MAVETRVIIDANAQNAIREIGKLDDAAADADKTIDKLDDQTVDVDTTAAVTALGKVGTAAVDAGGDVDRLDAKSAAVTVDFDVDTDKLDTIKRKTDDVESSGRAAGAAVGTFGGAIGELPGVSTLGPLAEGFGQLGEAALEGEASVAELGASLGAMAAVGFVLKSVTDHFKNIAAVKAFRKQEVDDYDAALKEADSTLGAIIAKLTSDEGLFINLFGSEEDITPVFAALGTGVEQVGLLIDGGKPKIDAWAEALRNGGADADAVAIASLALKQQVEDLDTAQQNAKTTAEFFNTETNKTTGELHLAKDAVKELASGFDAAAIKVKQLEDANRSLRGDLDKRDAYLNLLDAFDDLKTKGQEAWDAAKTGSADAETKARDYEQAQIAVKQGVIDYTEQIGKVPTNITTDLITKVDSGELDTLTHDLDILTMGVKTVDVRVRTTVDEAWNSVVNSVRLGGTRI